jgi:hypothetical protein
VANGKEPPQESDLQKAERRMRDEMARQRRAEEAQLKAVKYGCIGIIVAVVVIMVVLFLFF